MSCITRPRCSSGDGNNRIFNEKPSGDYDCLNVDYETAQNFIDGSLVVRLDGIALDPLQYTIGAESKSFSLIVDPSNPKALNAPPDSEECLRVDYNPQSDGTNDCITLL